MKSCKWGTTRVLEPKNALPQPAWKLNNLMEIYDNEMLVEVETLNVNTVSFAQIYNECEGIPEKIADKILKIVETRGKLHNPITGTGGMLIGRIKKIGKAYENIYNIAVGDRVASLSSLSLTPLKIYEIIKIYPQLSQVDVRAEAILFQSAPLVKVPDEYPLWLVTAVLDEAGAPTQTWNLVNKGDTVLIMGAGGKLGLLCAFAARQKLGSEGKLIGLVRHRRTCAMLKNAGIFDQLIATDAYRPLEALKGLTAEVDITVNVINIPGTETLSILATKDGGKVFFPNLASNHNVASLTAEGIGKDIDVYVYKGYVHNHADFALDLLRQNTALRSILSTRYEKDRKTNPAKSGLLPNTDLDSKLLMEIGLENYVFESSEIKQVLRNALRVANYDCTVLITGESGVGKEIFAHILHKGSSRCKSSLIKVNCGSIPQNLLESELFGYEGGSFTGAKTQGKMGIFEAAQGGTLFLDEIGELPIALQVKLLRAIQEKEIYRVGGIKPIRVDVRIIAATNKNLKRMVEEGVFREDLFYRLNVFPINIPSLRQRSQDIIPLAKFFVAKYNEKFKLKKRFEPEALSCLLDYSWPGNIREMENMIQRMLITSVDDGITAAGITDSINFEGQGKGASEHNKSSIKHVLDEKEFAILKETRSRYKSTREMAKALNMSQATLIRRLKKYGL